VGLYQAIYGVNPLHNRFYLEPHITPELAGTELRYKFRGQLLRIGLDTGHYVVADRGWSITASSAFGFFHTGDILQYFAGTGERPSLEATTNKTLKLEVLHWDAGRREWKQETTGPVDYLIRGLKPGTRYSYFQQGKLLKKITSNVAGEVKFHSEACFLHGSCVLRLCADGD
jgi:hypothetical protein